MQLCIIAQIMQVVIFFKVNYLLFMCSKMLKVEI